MIGDHRFRVALVGLCLAACGGGGGDASGEASFGNGEGYTPSDRPEGTAQVDAASPPEPGQCSAFACVPPACCGQACRSDDDCCRGTGCSADGVCIPESCRGCGGLEPFCTYSLDTCEGECTPPPSCGEACNEATPCGAGTRCNVFDSGESYCVPDAFEEMCRARCSDGNGPFNCTFVFAECDVTCAPPAPPTPPSCCLADCQSDGDCCAGTFCGPNGRCLPDGCEACNGYLPFCETDPETCAPTCVPPPTCGELCEGDADCGPRAVCNEFLDGARKCVPDQFEAACGACGETCLFQGSDCSVSCQSDAPMPPPDDPSRPEEGDGGVEPPAAICALCCDACRTDADCCAGFSCDDAAGRCIPGECSGCASGRCEFVCPPGATVP